MIIDNRLFMSRPIGHGKLEYHGNNIIIIHLYKLFYFPYEAVFAHISLDV